MTAGQRMEGILARARRELRSANRQQGQEIRKRALVDIREAAATAPIPLRAVHHESSLVESRPIGRRWGR